MTNNQQTGTSLFAIDYVNGLFPATDFFPMILIDIDATDPQAIS